MAEVLIDHCTLRIVRRGGWSWGPDPKGLVDAALRALPTLLAQQLESLFGDDEDRTYEAPVRIRIALRTSDLTAGTSETAGWAPSLSPQDPVPIERQVDMALRSALGIAAPPEIVPVETGGSVRRRFQSSEDRPRNLGGRPSAVGHLLLSRLDSNELDHFLAAFTLQELEFWHHVLNAAPRPVEVDAVISAAAVEEVLAEALARYTVPPGSSRAASLRLRLTLATIGAAKLRIAFDSTAIRQALDHVVPLSDPVPLKAETELPTASAEEMPTPQRVQSGLEAAASVPLPLGNARLSRPSARPSHEWTTQVHCALPFLLLGPLARIGYLETLCAVLEAAHLTREARHFAAALAYKALDPPARGWCRSEAARHTASVFAGSTSAIPDEALLEFSRRIAPHTGILNHQIEESVMKGRDTAQPLLLCGAGSEWPSGYLLVDTAGCFPVAWIEDASSAGLALLRSQAPVVVVTEDVSDPRLFRELHAAGIRFVTKVPPVQGESWNPVRRGSSRLGWTNDPDASSRAVVRAALLARISSEEAMELWDRLGRRQAAVPRAAQFELEHALMLAASAALGIMAWELWRDNGRTTPQLALERLCDLEARVAFSEDTVAVGLPLGRRRSELDQSGLLAPVRDVPWLEGRRLEFVWG